MNVKKKVGLTWLLLMAIGFFTIMIGVEESWDERLFILLILLPPTAAGALGIHQFELLATWSLSRQRRGIVPFVRPFVRVEISAESSEVRRALMQIARSHARFKRFDIDRPNSLVFTTRMSWRSFGENVGLTIEPKGRILSRSPGDVV